MHVCFGNKNTFPLHYCLLSALIAAAWGVLTRVDMLFEQWFRMLQVKCMCFWGGLIYFRHKSMWFWLDLLIALRISRAFDCSTGVVSRAFDCWSQMHVLLGLFDWKACEFALFINLSAQVQRISRAFDLFVKSTCFCLYCILNCMCFWCQKHVNSALVNWWHVWCCVGPPPPAGKALLQAPPRLVQVQDYRGWPSIKNTVYKELRLNWGSIPPKSLLEYFVNQRDWEALDWIFGN